MSDNSITSIRTVAYAAVSETLVKSKALNPQKTGAPESTGAAKQMESEAAGSSFDTPVPANIKSDMANVSIFFRVDDQTKELAVFVIDRTSKRILRSIPASEFNSMEAGELLKLTA